MNINKVNTHNERSFSGHLLPKHAVWFRKINPAAIEDYFSDLGVEAHFKGQRVPAGLSLLASLVAKKLGIPIPSAFFVRTAPKNTVAQSWFLRDRKPHPFKHLSVQYGRDVLSRSIKSFNQMMDSGKYFYGTTHFLNIPLHEIMHCNLFKKIGDKYAYWHTNWDKVIDNKFSKIDLTPFSSEIKKRIGEYGATDAIELHAVYWAKEICMSLNSNLKPKYNPFETPKIKLSPLLREFITKLSDADYSGAVAVSKKAKKLQNGV